MSESGKKSRSLHRSSYRLLRATGRLKYPSLFPLEEKDIPELYESLPSVKVEGIIPVFRYRSKRTGLTVCLAEIEGPVVNGYFCLATEVHDDNGLPHALEHLIFLGSELYPYKGVLDLAANRCLASGTNASTEVDHTHYTVVTAGTNGFLQLLPIYLDHILYPTLKESGFITEVHYVDSAGEDSGVVYSEMQGVENACENMARAAVQRALYPKPSGYHYETGGTTKNLRESTNNEKVKNYHSAFYRPENLCIIVIGHVASLDFFCALEPFEQRICNKHNKSTFARPWQIPVPPLNEDVTLVFPYPCEDEKSGLVIAAWRGPHCTEISSAIVGLRQLLEYLTEASVSPLQREFVELANPFCTTVTYSFQENLETCFCLVFENVPTRTLSLIKERLITVIRGIAVGDEILDMKRLRCLLRRRILTILSVLEEDSQDIIAWHLMKDFLYGVDIKDLDKRINRTAILRELLNKPIEYWLALLWKYLINTKLVMVIASPSQQLMKEMTAAEIQRVNKQQVQLGEKGLKEKERQLRDAVRQNEILPPKDMIRSIPVASINGIIFHSVKRSNNHFQEQADSNPSFPLSSLPLCFLLDDVHSHFIRMTALLSTDELSPQLRLYLPLLVEAIAESPILCDGILVLHEEIIAHLFEDTIQHGASLGISSGGKGSRFSCGPIAQLFQLTLRVEFECYAKGVQWLHELLFCTQFTPERIKIVASKMVNSVAYIKRTGYVIAQSIMKDLCYGHDSNHYSSNLMRQYSFLNLVLIKLEANPQQVINDLNKVRNTLLSSDNITIYMAADVEQLAKLTSPLEPWKTFLQPSQPATKHRRCVSAVKCCHSLITPKYKSPAVAAIIGVGTVDSGYLVQSAPFLTTYNHPDLPAVMVVLQYLAQIEGPMWRRIRGLGLAYSYSISLRPDQGLIYLVLYQCSHIVTAYKEMKRIVERHISGEEEWDESLLESARNSRIFEIIQREKNVAGVCHESLLSYYKGIGPDYSKELLQKISDVTVEDLRRVGPLHVAPLVNEEKSRCSICCHSAKVDEVVRDFKANLKFSEGLRSVSKFDVLKIIFIDKKIFLEFK